MEHSPAGPLARYKSLVDKERVGSTADAAMRMCVFEAQALCEVDPKLSTGAAIVKVLYAHHCGLSTMEVAGNSYVIDGKLAFYGEYPQGLAMRRSGLEEPEVRWSLNGTDLPVGGELTYAEDPVADWPSGLTVTFSAARNGVRYSQSYSVGMARRADLWGKRAWGKYPLEMLIAKARARLIKLYFPDALQGANIAEDLPGYDPDRREPRVPEYESKGEAITPDDLEPADVANPEEKAVDETAASGEAEKDEGESGEDRDLADGDPGVTF